MRKLTVLILGVFVSAVALLLGGCLSPTSEEAEKTTTEYAADGVTPVSVTRESQKKTESVVKTTTATTQDKTLAIGSDTWGGGGKASTVDVSGAPLPTMEGWFGRRRVWYVSVKTAAQGRAAAEVVKASNSSLTAGVSADGVTVSNDTSDNDNK